MHPKNPCTDSIRNSRLEKWPFGAILKYQCKEAKLVGEPSDKIQKPGTMNKERKEAFQ